MLHDDSTLLEVHSLPQELFRAIIEQLWDDGRALGASSLVCSAWRAAARSFVYRKVIIRNSENITKLAHQIQYEPRITSWIQTLRFEGRSVPRVDLPGPITNTTEMDMDAWIYPFFSIIGTRLLNVRNLELFGFQHMSLRSADCYAFAEWILDLSRMDSVELLHLARCEMPPNALTAIIRSFRRLRDVAFTCVSCRVIAQNGAELIGLSDVTSDSVQTGECSQTGQRLAHNLNAYICSKVRRLSQGRCSEIPSILPTPAITFALN